MIGAVAGAIDCSVLVPVYNEARYIEPTVAAMRRQRYDGELELLFADGGSSDGTKAILEALAREDPRLRVLDNPRRSVSSGLNLALKHARGRWIVRMDAHTVYPDDYIARGIERLRAGGTPWVSGPPVPKGHGRVSRAVALALSTSLGRGGSRKWGRASERDQPELELDAGVFGGVWQRTTLLEYGGWDERWVSNEDAEMAGRFLERDQRLICLPAMAAEYVPRDSLPGLWRQYAAYGRYRVRTATRHPVTMRRSHILPPAVVLNAGLALAGPAKLRALARLGAALHVAGLVLTGLRALPEAEMPTDAALVPVVLGTMHLAWGWGALAGVAEHGFPAAALARASGAQWLAESHAPAAEPVFAPSLA